MLDKVYCVFCFSDWDDEIVEINDVFFTNKEAAEVYSELCKLREPSFDHRIIELKCQDRMVEDYRIFIDNLKEEKKLKDEAERIWRKKRDIREYARLKAKLERNDPLNFIDIERELLKKHGLE